MSLNSDVFGDVFSQALYALKDNKLRTILSILGIAIGIGAVMTVGTITQGMKKYVYKELETYGLRSVWIYRDWGEDDPTKIVRRGSGIDNEDFKIIRSGCCPSVKRATPQIYSEATDLKIHAGSSFYNASIEGVGLEYLKINNDNLSRGRNFRKVDIQRKKPVAIIGVKVIKELFGRRTNVIGKSFRFYKQKYTIIGILEAKNRDLLSQIGADSYDINGRVLIPYTLYQSLMGSKDIHTLQAEAVSVEKTKSAIKQITDLLERRHSYRYKYKTESMDAWISQANEVLLLIAGAGLLLASIALLVGGMAIMNIMSTSVIERTREIGIRKALGAQYKDILNQFLLEAVVVSVIGGIIGLILGGITAHLIGFFSGYELDPSWMTAIFALFVSMLVGVLSGYYPAHRAAKLRPVDALRYE